MLQAYFHMCQMPTYSIPANLGRDNILKAHIALGPRYYHVCSMCARQHICGPARSSPANRDKIYGCSKHSIQHICRPARSGPANRDKIYGRSKCASQHICATAMSSPVRSKCTALLNWKHGRFGMVRVLASAHALRLTTYYHVPEYFG